MNKRLLLQKTRKYVKEQMSGEGTGHDWFHVERVLKSSLHIAKNEKQVDLFLLQMIALLHDIADWKFQKNPDASIERKWLQSLNVDPAMIDTICSGVQSISFKGGTNQLPPQTIEAKIVQDADRLDALGAIGIARAFAYGGFKNREMYNPEKKPQKFTSEVAYKKHIGTTVNHFYEKLFLIRKLMHTKTAKAIAKEREAFMKQFLDEFYAEWTGKL